MEPQASVPTQEDHLQPVVPETILKSKIPIIVTGLAVLVLMIGIVFFVVMSQKKEIANSNSANVPTATTSRFSDWQTYTSSKYGVSFNHPPSWKTDSTDPNTLITIREGHAINSGIELGTASIKIAESTESFEDAVSALSGVEKREDTVLSSNPAVRLSGSQGIAGSVHFVTVLSRYQDRNIIISLYTQDTKLLPAVTAEFDNILSTVKFVEQDLQSKNQNTYTYKTFSFRYPSTWNVFDSNSRKDFFSTYNINNYTHAIVLEKGDSVLLITIDAQSVGEAGGIFLSDDELAEYKKTHDELQIEGETYFLFKMSTTLASRVDPDTHGGIAGAYSLARFIPDRVTDNDGKTFDGYEDYIQNKKGLSYAFIKLRKSKESDDAPTPRDIQGELIEILKSIKW